MRSYLRTKDYFLSQEQFELLYDDVLDMLATHPKPSNLSKYYESENYISHSDGKVSFLEKVYQRIKKVNLQKKTSLAGYYIENNKTLLDVGAGTGDFLLCAKSKNWKVFGVEPNGKARNLAKEKGIVVKETLKDVQGQKFDIITLWHVLEHLPNLEESIERLSNLLQDDGTLIIAVPNFKSYDAKFYGKFWAAYDVPRHLWHFSKTAIQKLFQKQRMEIIKVKPMWFDSFYVSLLSEEYKTGKKNWAKAFLVGLWSNVLGIFTKEHSSHIYILKKSK